MSEELTRERIETYANAEWTKPEIRSMAKQLLAEMDKPSVWTNAPDNATIAKVHFYIADKVYARANGIPEVYTRKTPKSRTRIMAEEIASAHISNKDDLIDIIEQTINAHMEELKVQA